MTRRYGVQWVSAGLMALEPSDSELAASAPELAAAYNDPHNRAMLGNATHMSAHDVVAHYQLLRAAGGRPLIFFQDVDQDELALVGDGDLRNIEKTRAEFALLIAQTSAHGKGLGTRFALMLHALAFAPKGLDVDELFVTILPGNAASQRLFAKLGYAVDQRPAARRYIDDESDISMSVDRARFTAAHATELAEISVFVRDLS